MDRALISIVTPYYNKASTIQRSIESVLNQTYLNWELILVDDRSEVPLNEIFHSDDKRIQILVNDRNLGPGPARQKGLDIAKGEYVAFLDADDYWESTFLIESISTFRAGTAGVWSRTKVFDNNSDYLKKYNLIPHKSIKEYLLDYGHPICTSSFLWNKDVLVNWSDLSTEQDSMFELQISFKCDVITPTNNLLVNQDKSGYEHRSRYVSIEDSLFNKFLVYSEFFKIRSLNIIDKSKLFLWLYRLAVLLEKENDKRHVIIFSVINEKFGIKSKFWMCYLNFFLHLIGIKVNYGISTLVLKFKTRNN